MGHGSLRTSLCETRESVVAINCVVGAWAQRKSYKHRINSR